MPFTPRGTFELAILKCHSLILIGLQTCLAWPTTLLKMWMLMPFNWTCIPWFQYRAPAPTPSSYPPMRHSHLYIPPGHQRHLSLWTSIYYAFLRTVIIRGFPILSQFTSTVSPKRHYSGSEGTKKLVPPTVDSLYPHIMQEDLGLEWIELGPDASSLLGFFIQSLRFFTYFQDFAAISESV